MGKTSKADIKSDIDSLFSKKGKAITKDKLKVEAAKVAKTAKVAKPAETEKPGIKIEAIKKVPKKEMKEIKNPEPDASKIRKRTEEGFKIYNLEELNIGKGGETEDCPFDCDCCF